jgi:hypothetical protein
MRLIKDTNLLTIGYKTKTPGFLQGSVQCLNATGFTPMAKQIYKVPGTETNLIESNSKN